MRATCAITQVAGDHLASLEHPPSRWPSSGRMERAGGDRRPMDARASGRCPARKTPARGALFCARARSLSTAPLCRVPASSSLFALLFFARAPRDKLLPVGQTGISSSRARVVFPCCPFSRLIINSNENLFFTSRLALLSIILNTSQVY